MIKKAAEWALTHILELVLSGFAVALPTWLLWAEDRLLPHIAQVKSIWVLRGLAIAVAVILCSFAYIVSLKPCLKWVAIIGVYQDRKTGRYYCASCKQLHKTLSPLKTEESGWRCMVRGCDKFYRNPDYRRPPEERSNQEGQW